MTIPENLDFVFETNILGATTSDSIKFKKLETFTATGTIDNGERAFCGNYIYLTGLNSNNSVMVKYSINIPMTNVNLFDKISILPTFFGNWTLDIIPTLENMIMKDINIGGVSTITCTDVKKETKFQCYGVENAC
jgi:hypothetical protein